jgi:hypothetical protein
MIITGSVLLLMGVIGVIVSLRDRTTTGWAATRAKFVVTSWGLIASGITIIVAGIQDVQLTYRWFIP